jgi:hypothetical protein
VPGICDWHSELFGASSASFFLIGLLAVIGVLALIF